MNNDNLYVCKNCLKKMLNVPYTSPFQFRGLFIYYKVPEDMICPKCKNNIEKTNVTMEEIKILINVSHDSNFIEAMIDLRDKDIIEYNLKLGQFKNQVQQQVDSKKQEMNNPHCPTCGSVNIEKISGLERGTSVAIWGLFSKKINKTYKCKNCGHTW